MNLLANQKLWNAVLKTPPVKWMLKTALRTCPECNRTPLETALDNYSRTNSPICPSCTLHVNIINFWIDFVQKTLAVEKSRISKLLSDPYTKTAIRSIVTGFADFGFNRPLKIHAPLLVVWNFTYKCNLKCQHCYSTSGNISKMELSTKEAMDVVDQIADFGVTPWHFLGASP